CEQIDAFKTVVRDREFLFRVFVGALEKKFKNEAYESGHKTY
ncbi:5830_t:CDS:1, partial [Dentiscutata erythropus]